MDTSFNMFNETEVPAGEVIISRTDLDGVITYANDTFAEISGYSAEELVGQPHNILRHPDMPKSVFKEMWKTIRAENSWEGYVKNMRKDRGYYWVHARVSGVYKDGRLVEYKSLRAYVPMEKRREMQAVYDSMRLEENDRVRMVSYIKADLFKQLENEAAEQKIGLDRLILRKLSR